MSSEKNYNWTPPAAFEPVKGRSLHFDVEDVADDTTELVLLRLPPSLSINSVDGLKLELDAPVAGKWLLERGNEACKYEVKPLKDQSEVGGEEMSNLVLLLPDHAKDGQVTVSAKQISRSFIVARKVDEPDVSTKGEALKQALPVIRAQPEGMKDQFSGSPFTPVTKYDLRKRKHDDSTKTEKSPKKSKLKKKDEEEQEDEDMGAVVVKEAKRVKKKAKKASA
ncbi:hypothetical protein BJ684DRAFT_15204 [Piptocephalis cylindrospora]|uniref:Uncharacterized protein n=1 Tax=Piptocephalis cylindrospora TaxID=1907219 RepID=A0A4P9Y696_9FUNG|nr:hypothetical protein BJ684DRAFT_15204 [Piptocephalis cylindrospora]|eukprot:RKP14483.1 hypothetical protein BJ684DRAFT_15204 [Piptocephalis cylindrospora]